MFSEAQYQMQYFDGADTIPSQALSILIDSADAETWQIGRPQKPLFDTAATPPNVLVTDTVQPYGINDTASFFFYIKPDYVSNWGIWSIQWVQKLDLDSAMDGAYIEFSVDSQKTWQSIFDNPLVYNFYGFEQRNIMLMPDGEKAFSGTDSTWRNIWLCFDVSWMSVQEDTLWLRYTLKSDSTSNQRDGWMIDNVISHETIFHTIAEIEQEHYLQVGPNPTNGMVNIKARKLREFHIIENMTLYDAHGKLIRSFRNSPTKFSIDLAPYPDGVYFLKIKTNKQTEVFKLLLKH